MCIWLRFVEKWLWIRWFFVQPFIDQFIGQCIQHIQHNDVGFTPNNIVIWNNRFEYGFVEIFCDDAFDYNTKYFG